MSNSITSLTDPQLMIAVAPMDDFLSDPISDVLVEKGSDTSFNNDTNVNIFIGSPAYRDHFPHNYGRTIMVEDLDDLRSWENRLLSSPMLIDAKCEAKSKEKAPDEGFWAVICNTRHPSMRRQMENGFDRAKHAIQNGKRYMLEYDFREVLTAWFAERGLENFKCKYAKLRITNHMFFEDLNQMICGYDKWIGVLLSVLCCPCISCGLCVNAIRLCYRVDTQFNVEGSLQELQIGVKHRQIQNSRSNQQRSSSAGVQQKKDWYGSFESESGYPEVTDVTEQTALLK
ncbi:uncharacterized protein [Ptychodera flava]|uniref:uncharacterized protein n=1 Tax=Ptychodera flava TaxID=63121 RepID=UPI00396A6D47